MAGECTLSVLKSISSGGNKRIESHYHLFQKLHLETSHKGIVYVYVESRYVYRTVVFTVIIYL